MQSIELAMKLKYITFRICFQFFQQHPTDSPPAFHSVSANDLTNFRIFLHISYIFALDERIFLWYDNDCRAKEDITNE